MGTVKKFLCLSLIVGLLFLTIQASTLIELLNYNLYSPEELSSLLVIGVVSSISTSIIIFFCATSVFRKKPIGNNKRVSRIIIYLFSVIAMLITSTESGILALLGVVFVLTGRKQPSSKQKQAQQSNRTDSAAHNAHLELVERLRGSIDTEKKSITEEDLKASKEKRFCLVHKGPIEGYNYKCRKCGAFYCMKCYEALVDIENMCWSCDALLDPSKPAKDTEKEEEEIIEQREVEELRKNRKTHKN